MSDIPDFLNAPQDEQPTETPAAPPQRLRSEDYIEPLPAGMVEPGNINLNNRERVPVAGGYATVRSMSFGTDQGEVLVPSVADGRELSPDEAQARYEQTGEHLGIFKTPDDATAYAEQLHRDQAIQYDPETEARRAGYSWPEINDHIATSTATALDAGYSLNEISRFLGRQDPTAFEDRSRAQWTGAMAADPTMLADISRGDLSLDAIPSMRSDYAAALLNDEVRGPLDFAYRYAAAALDVAHSDLGVDDSNAQVVRQKQAQAAGAAEAAAAGLPTREDLVDATLALTTGDREADQDQVRTNLLNHWLETGQDPDRAAMQAQTDGALSDKLTSPPPMPAPGLFDYIAQAQRSDQVSPDIAAIAPAAVDMLGQLIGQHFQSVIKDLGDWGVAQQAIADRLEGKPLGERVTDPEAMETAYQAAFVLMPQNIRKVTADLIRGLPEPKIAVTDLNKPPGSAIGEAPITEAVKSVEPAQFQHEATPPEPGAPAEPVKFVEDSTPAERIARIAQDAGEDVRASPTFFEDKLAAMGETDPATVELAKANDLVARFAKWIGDVFHDESGAGPGIPMSSGEVIPGSYRARVVGKDYAEDLIRRISTGLGTQRSENIAQGFEEFFKDLAPFMPRFRQEMAKPGGGAWAETEIGKVLRAAEGDGTVTPDSRAARYVAYRAQQNARMVSDIEAAVERGDLDKFQARDFYLAHMYTRESLNTPPGVTGGGRTGSQGWRNERTFPTYADAFGEGYKPLYDNPILIDIASADAHYKVLDTVRMQSIAREANWMRYYQSAREAARDDFHPLTGLNSLKEASSVNPDGTPGPVIRQQLYGRAGFDTIWNNWNGFQNLNRSQLATTIEDGLLKVKNASTYGKLLFPGYHTITEYKLGMSNGIANAIEELGFGLRHGSIGEFARGMRDLATAPFKPIQYIATSAAKWRPMYRAMEGDPALDAFVGGGGGIAARGKVYSASDSPGIWKLWNRGQLFQELGAEMRRDFTFPNTRVGDGKWGVAGGLARDVTNLAILPLRSVAYGVTNLSAPVWDQMVPLLKSGASMERIQTFIRQNPMATDDMVRDYARRVVTNIEDRMGEYNPANLFWRPWMKRVANQTMLSTGWTYGTIHATMEGLRLGRGFAWNPVATTNLMGQVATIAFTNAAWSVLVDGKLPSSTLDYLIPFATSRGLARILLPGEEKEYYDWMKIVADTYAEYRVHGVLSASSQFAHSTFTYAAGKLAPMWQAAKTFVTGEDAIGHKIADQPGGILKFLEQSFAPIFFENWDKSKAIGLNAAENMFGLREAPKQLSDFWGYIATQEGLHNRWTKEELSRAGKEATALGQVPPEGYKQPAARGGGTARTSSGTGAGRSYSPVSSAAAQTYQPASNQPSSPSGQPQSTVEQGVAVSRGASRFAAPARGRVRAPRPANLLPKSQRRLRGRPVR